MKLTHEVAITSRDGDALLTVPATGQVLVLNAAARLIIERLAGGAQRGELLAALADRWPEEDEGRLASDLDAALADLATEGLLDRDAL